MSAYGLGTPGLVTAAFLVETFGVGMLRARFAAPAHVASLKGWCGVFITLGSSATTGWSFRLARVGFPVIAKQGVGAQAAILPQQET